MISSNVAATFEPRRKGDQTRFGWFPVLMVLSALFLVGTFAGLASIGAHQAELQQRVLGALDPLVAGIREHGEAWVQAAYAHACAVVLGLAVLATSAVAVGLTTNGRRGWPLVVLAISLVAAAAGQAAFVCLQSGLGAGLYVLALLAALVLGIARPILPAGEAIRGFGYRDLLCLTVLSIAALLVRLYALNELPHLFNGEMIHSMLASRTMDGLRWYVPDGVVSNSTGVMHLLPQMFFYKAFGTSVYSLRLAGVFFGVVVVPPFYWLAHRFAGTAAAVVATTLLISAPEQLYWSRLESTNFAPVPLLSVITAHLGLSMVERFRLGSVAAAALWMPWGRYFYTAGSALVFYPWLQFLHAVLWVRGTWRRAWYVVPLLSLGTALWMVALSGVVWLAGGGAFLLSNPARHGELVLRGVGAYSALSPLQLIAEQGRVSWGNLVAIVQAIAYEGVLSEWYQRAIVAGSTTWMVPPLVALVAVSLAYLLAQWRQPRIFSLLLWIGLALLPALLSMQPTDRRVVLLFPALYLAAGVATAAFLRLSREAGGRTVGLLFGVALGSVSAVSVGANLVSHFLLPMQRTGVEELIDFSKPIFRDSDAIFFDTDSSWAMVLAFGNADTFLAKPPCYRQVQVGEWLRVATELTCDFRDATYKALLSPQRTEAAQQSYNPQRITILIDMDTPSREAVPMLQQLFPAAAFRSITTNETPGFVALTFDKAAVDALRTPELQVADNVKGADKLRDTLVAGAQLELRLTGERDGGAGVRGGLFVSESGWYRVTALPACSGARLSLDGQNLAAAASLVPLLKGFHPFELELPDPLACRGPIRIEAQPSATEAGPQDTASVLVRPEAARVPGAQAEPLRTYAGHGEAKRIGATSGQVVVDFGLDAAGEVVVLTQGSEQLTGHRFAASGEELATWPVAIPSYLPLWGMVVAANGFSYVAAGGPLYVFDRDGNLVDHWPKPSIYSGQFTVLADGRLLSAVAQENAVFVLNPDGSVQDRWRAFDGGPGGFDRPLTVAMDEQGTIAVLDGTNQALLFSTPLDHFEPRFLGSFRVAYTQPPSPRVVGFDPEHRLVFADPAAGIPLVYDRDGSRLLAATPDRDLGTRGFGAPLRIAATTDRLYLLDAQRHLWQLPQRRMH